MKTFAQVGTEIGELAQQKNDAYGSSFEKAGEFLALLYPRGLQRQQYGTALLLVRIFDKQMRIATDADAFGESPFMDIAGYGILGTHLQLQQKEGNAEWLNNANGPTASASSKDASTDTAAQSTSAQATTNAEEKIAPQPSQRPSSSSDLHTSALVATATEAVSKSAGDLLDPFLNGRERTILSLLKDAFPGCLLDSRIRELLQARGFSIYGLERTIADLAKLKLITHRDSGYSLITEAGCEHLRRFA
jgi:hypothetical protein